MDLLVGAILEGFSALVERHLPDSSVSEESLSSELEVSVYRFYINVF